MKPRPGWGGCHWSPNSKPPHRLSWPQRSHLHFVKMESLLKTTYLDYTESSVCACSHHTFDSDQSNHVAQGRPAGIPTAIMDLEKKILTRSFSHLSHSCMWKEVDQGGVCMQTHILTHLPPHIHLLTRIGSPIQSHAHVTLTIT
jgi:hypothetical protein